MVDPALPASHRMVGPGHAAGADIAKILVAEDDRLVLMLMVEVLGRAAYQVVQAAGGAAAIAQVRQAGASFDLALVDLSMPGVDGIAVLAACRAELPGMPVILTSGYSEPAARERAGDLAPDAYLAKPWRAQSLTNLVAQLLASHPGPFVRRT